MDLPFTNIREVMSLHNKVSPEKIFLTVISDQGREELSYGEFSARCHQTANLLQEDLQIQPGDVVTILDDQPQDTAVLLMASWLVGAVVVPYGLGWQEIQTSSGKIKVQFIRHHDKPDSRDFGYPAENRRSKDGLLVKLGGMPLEGYPHFDTLVRSMPTSFFNDHAEPTLDTAAFFSVNYDTRLFVTVSQGELLKAAQTLVNTQAITGNQRLISYLALSGVPYPPHLALSTISILMTSLLVGSSLTISTTFEAQAFWREIAASRLHIACLSTDNIAGLISYARKQKAAGKPIYGEGVYQQDIKQLRHIYCPDTKGQDDLIRQFTALFPFPVVI